MRRRGRKPAQPDELTLAIGLVWGHLNAAQYEETNDLARACLALWPADQRLILMQAYAAVELGEGLHEKTLAVLRAAECREWVSILLRRSQRVRQAAPPRRH
jgi:hypothetical protein